MSGLTLTCLAFFIGATFGVLARLAMTGRLEPRDAPSGQRGMHWGVPGAVIFPVLTALVTASLVIIAPTILQWMADAVGK